MPFDGNGAYTAPVNSWNPAVSQSVIDPSDWNSTQSDYETGLSTMICRDGQSTLTNNIPFSGFKATGVNTNSGSTSRSEFASGATLQDGAPLSAGTTGGTSTAYTATLTPAIAAYAAGQTFKVKFNAACGNNPTIDFNSVGAKKIYKNVSGTPTQLSANDVPADFIGVLFYDTALDTAAGGFWLVNNTTIGPDSVTSAMLADQTEITWTEGAAPSAPASGKVITYAKTDGLMYSKDDAGTEYLMSLALTSLKVKQIVVTPVTAATFSTSSTSATDITGMSVTITPGSTSSKILILGTANLGASAEMFQYFLWERNGTAVGVGAAAGSRVQVNFRQYVQSSNAALQINPYPFMLSDSPSSTSALTYQLRGYVNTGTMYLNRTATDTDTSVFPRTYSFVVAVEYID